MHALTTAVAFSLSLLVTTLGYTSRPLAQDAQTPTGEQGSGAQLTQAGQPEPTAAPQPRRKHAKTRRGAKPSLAQADQSAPATSEDSQAGQRSPAVWRTVAGLRLLELTIGPPDSALPLVMFIHGRGDVAHTSWIDGLNAPGRYVFPQANTPHGTGFSWFVYNGLGPATAQLAVDVESCARQLAEVLAALRAERPTAGKAIVSGFSQGGVLSYALALLHPDQVALAVPMAGLLPDPLYAQLPVRGVQYPPIRALHGTEDTIVPFSTTANMTDALHARGIDITLQRFPGIGHAVPEEVRVSMQAEVRRGLAAQAREHARDERTPAKPPARALASAAVSGN